MEVPKIHKIKKSFKDKKQLIKHILDVDSDFEEFTIEVTAKNKQDKKVNPNQITQNKDQEGFTYEYDSYSAGRMKTDGHRYICKKCKCTGQLKYEGDQCSKCSNGWGCRSSCTLSSVQCPKCHQKKLL